MKVYIVEQFWRGDDRDESDTGGKELAGVFLSRIEAESAISKTTFSSLYRITEIETGKFLDR